VARVSTPTKRKKSRKKKAAWSPASGGLLPKGGRTMFPATEAVHCPMPKEESDGVPKEKKNPADVARLPGLALL
jgi:hypothetical protein